MPEGGASRNSERSGVSAPEPGKLLTAGELAERLSPPESWVRSEERAGRIPGVRAGKYVRFKLADVAQARAQRKRQGTSPGVIFAYPGGVDVSRHTTLVT